MNPVRKQWKEKKLLDFSAEWENSSGSPLEIAFFCCRTSWYVWKFMVLKLEGLIWIWSRWTWVTFIRKSWSWFVVRRSHWLIHLRQFTHHEQMQYYLKLHQNYINLIENSIFNNFRYHIETYAIRCICPWWIKGRKKILKKYFE